jgi:hypothetical protein
MGESEKPTAAGRRASALLLAGMLAGIGTAIFSLVRGGAGLPDEAVARVNDHVIARADWERAVAAVASERRTPLTAADRRHILDRLVDEELLMQHGLDVGLARQDRRLRGQLVADVMATATSEVAEPDEPALHVWYDSHRDYFTSTGRMRVAATRNGQPFAPPVPDALLSPAKLREYLGPRLTQVAVTMAPGETRASGDDDAVMLRMLQKEPVQTPSFEDVREEVRAAVQRDAEERAVRRLLDELRGEARVAVRENLE